jgi:hypothetical protein
MERTVLSVDFTGSVDPVTKFGRFQIRVEKYVANIPGMTYSRPLELSSMPDWSTPDPVAARGRLLRDALRKHTGLAGVLDALEQLPSNTRMPLYVKLSEGDAELITWETLCDTADKFFALDPRWPIGRITDPAQTFERPAPVFRVPVRISVVISALGIDQQIREWEVLRDATDVSHANGLPVELQLFTGDAAVHAQATADAAAGRPWITVSGVPASYAQLFSDMRRFRPNVVHFFCHGHSSDNAQQIEIALKSDYDDPAITRGSVIVTKESLVTFGESLQNPWLILLNCCEGAQATSESPSLAHRLVSTAFPAALAMLEPVDAADAYEFTRAIYESLFAELADVRTKLSAGDSVTFEWATITHAARDAINAMHQGAAGAQRAWALPALYVRGVRAMEFRAAKDDTTDDELVARKAALEAVTDWLRAVKDSLPEERRLAAIEQALASEQVPRAFWPRLDGTYRG